MWWPPVSFLARKEGEGERGAKGVIGKNGNKTQGLQCTLHSTVFTVLHYTLALFFCTAIQGSVPTLIRDINIGQCTAEQSCRVEWLDVGATFFTGYSSPTTTTHPLNSPSTLFLLSSRIALSTSYYPFTFHWTINPTKTFPIPSLQIWFFLLCSQLSLSNPTSSVISSQILFSTIQAIQKEMTGKKKGGISLNFSWPWSSFILISPDVLNQCVILILIEGDDRGEALQCPCPCFFFDRPDYNPLILSSWSPVSS